MSPEDARVVGTCECGTCPSIYLAGRAGPAVGDHHATRIIEASTEAALVLLHLQADVPTLLEIAPTTSAPSVEMTTPSWESGKAVATPMFSCVPHELGDGRKPQRPEHHKGGELSARQVGPSGARACAERMQVIPTERLRRDRPKARHLADPQYRRIRDEAGAREQHGRQFVAQRDDGVVGGVPHALAAAVFPTDRGRARRDDDERETAKELREGGRPFAIANDAEQREDECYAPIVGSNNGGADLAPVAGTAPPEADARRATSSPRCLLPAPSSAHRARESCRGTSP